MKILSRLDNLKSFQNVFNCITPHPYPPDHLPRPYKLAKLHKPCNNCANKKDFEKLLKLARSLHGLRSLAKIVPRFKSFRVYSKNFLKASALFQSSDNPEHTLKSLKRLALITKTYKAFQRLRKLCNASHALKIHHARSVPKLQKALYV